MMIVLNKYIMSLHGNRVNRCGEKLTFLVFIKSNTIIYYEYFPKFKMINDKLHITMKIKINLKDIVNRQLLRYREIPIFNNESFHKILVILGDVYISITLQWKSNVLVMYWDGN